MAELFISSKARYRKSVADEAYRKLHWTKQLEMRPLIDRRNDYSQYEEGDYSNRLDNWDDPEGYDEPQAKQ